MSQEPVALDAVPILQPTSGKRGRPLLHELHPRLREQHAQAQQAVRRRICHNCCR
jgi:hypothetical protein